jgi:hypothetical protein
MSLCSLASLRETFLNKNIKTARYPATPLAKKLSIKGGSKNRLINPPEYYFNLFSDMPENISILTDTKTKKNLIHCFVKQEKELHKNIASLKNEIEPNGIIWI